MSAGYRFGFAPASRAQRQAAIGRVFASVAGRYDCMNDAMSLGLHRLWKRQLVCLAAPRGAESWLDVAAGSGDVARLIAASAPQARVVAADPSAPMLARARQRLAGRARVAFAQCAAERLPFAAASFDGVACAFGVRNFTDLDAGLAELRRVLRPGGRLAVLEFAKPQPWLRGAHRRYLLDVLPAMGAQLAGDGASYRYLAESILTFSDQRELAARLGEAGFAGVRWFNVAAGVATLYRGWRLL